MAQFNSFLLTTRPTYVVNVSIFLSVCLFLLTPHQGTKRNEWNPKLVGQTVPDRIFVFFSFSPHATSWHKANSPDTAPYRSSTDFSSFPLRRLVAQSRSPRHTAQSVSDRFFLSYMHHLVVHFVSLFSFFTLPRGTEQNSPTHCSNGPRSTFLFFFFPFLTPPCGTPPRRTEQKFSTHR